MRSSTTLARAMKPRRRRSWLRAWSGRVAAELRGSGRDALAIRCDVSIAADSSNLAALVRERDGRLDVLHSNAFALELAPAHRLGDRSWERQLGVSLSGVYLSVYTF